MKKDYITALDYREWKESVRIDTLNLLKRMNTAINKRAFELNSVEAAKKALGLW